MDYFTAVYFDLIPNTPTCCRLLLEKHSLKTAVATCFSALQSIFFLIINYIQYVQTIFLGSRLQRNRSVGADSHGTEEFNARLTLTLSYCHKGSHKPFSIHAQSAQSKRGTHPRVPKTASVVYIHNRQLVLRPTSRRGDSGPSMM